MCCLIFIHVTKGHRAFDCLFLLSLHNGKRAHQSRVADEGTEAQSRAAGPAQRFPEHACRSGAFPAAESAMERRPGKPWESEGHPHQEAVEALMVTLQSHSRTRCSAGLAGRPAQTFAPALSPRAIPARSCLCRRGTRSQRHWTPDGFPAAEPRGSTRAWGPGSGPGEGLRRRS